MRLQCDESRASLKDQQHQHHVIVAGELFLLDRFDGGQAANPLQHNPRKDLPRLRSALLLLLLQYCPDSDQDAISENQMEFGNAWPASHRKPTIHLLTFVNHGEHEIQKPLFANDA